MAFSTKWLVAPKNQRRLDKLVSGSGEIPYFIRRKAFNGILETEYGNTFTYKIKGSAQSNKIRKWIKKLVVHLDSTLDVDFREVKAASDARIQFLAD